MLPMINSCIYTYTYTLHVVSVTCLALSWAYCLCDTNYRKGMTDSTIVRGAGRNKRTWTTKEDEKLVDALMELHASGKYTYADNGFKPGYFQKVQDLLDISLPNSGLRAEPHIKSRLKTLKANFSVVHDMLVGTHGFSWDPEKCSVTASDQVWEEYIKTHRNAAHIRDKPFPFYDKLSIIFGSKRTSGSRALDLGGEEVGETQRSTPIEVEDQDLRIDPRVPLSKGGTGSMSSERKRAKNAPFNHTCVDPCTMFNVTFNFGKNLSTDFKVVASERNSPVDLMRRVVKELDGLSGITLDERIKAMDVIGNSPTRAEMFFMLDKTAKIRLVQMIGCGSIS